MDITNKIHMLDRAFSSYLLSKDEKALKQNLQSILSTMSSKSITVEIVDNSGARTNEPFFGTRIHPDPESIEGLVEDMLSDNTPSFRKILDRWRHIDDWHIEIDSRMFDRNVINFNPEELTAMILHEIGHTIYSDRTIERWYRSFMECRVKMTTSNRMSAKILHFLYAIPLSIACSIREWKIDDRDLNEEIFADQTVQKLGYSKHLISAFQKIIKAYGTSSKTVNPSQGDAEIQRSIIWCNLNADDLVTRKNKLKDELYYKGTRTNSVFMRDLIRSIMGKLSLKTQNRYSGNIVMESVSFDNSVEFLTDNKLVYDLKGFNELTIRLRAAQESAANKIANESLLFHKPSIKKKDIPSQYDLDAIFVEIDRIQNHADRIYVLDLIYHEEDKIEKMREMFKVDSSLKAKYAHKMDSMMLELENLRQETLKKRNFDKQYKLFVKYPTGYEG